MTSFRNILGVAAAVLALSIAVLAADQASGTVKFKTFTGAVKFAWLVRGPDEMDPSKTVLRIYLSSADIGAKIKACKTLSCAVGPLQDGAIVDSSAARAPASALRLNRDRSQSSA